MIKKFTFVVIIVSSIMAILLLSPIALGWFHDATVSDASVDGAIIGSYFEYGDGSEAHPFGIAQPKQLYYLAWLQDLGYFNKVENGQVKQVYFELSNKYGDVIDFSEGDTPYIIPPIGTTTYPFVGSFDGKGVTLANLTIDNKYLNLVTPPENDGTTAYTEVQDGAQIVGMFGVVGAVSQNTTGTTATVNGGTYDTAVNQIGTFQIDGITIKSTAPKNSYTLIGILAGYVNGNINGVAVSNSNVVVSDGITHLSTIEDKNVVSEFGLVGYCEEAYKESINITSLSATVPFETQNIIFKNSAAEGAGWGGSIDIKELHTRLQNVLRLASNTTRYVSREAHYINTATGEDRIVELQTASIGTNNPSGRTFKYYQSELGGSFMFGDYNTTSSSQVYDLFHGLSSRYWPKTIVTYTATGAPQNGFIITDGNGNYLKASNNAVSNTTDEADATIFVRNNNGSVDFKYDDPSSNTTTISTYYLNLNNNNVLTVANSSSTNWTVANGEIYATKSSLDYGIWFHNDTWDVITRQYAVYKDGDYYLKVTTSGSSGVTSIEDATQWRFSAADDNAGYIFTIIDGTTYYLRHTNNQLTINTTSSNTYQWTWDSAFSSLKTEYNSVMYGVEYNGTNWIISSNPCYIISDGSNYLTVSNGNIDNTTNKSNAAKWVFSNGDNGGVISTTVNGTTYYLYNNNNTLTLSTTNQTNWSYANNCIYDGDYYIEYSNGWKLTKTDYFYINQGTNYLYIYRTTGYNATTTFGNTTTQSNAQGWILNNGKLSATYNGTTYYLYYAEEDWWNGIEEGLNVTTSSSTATGTWAYDSSTGLMTHTLSGTTRYLKLNGTTWSLDTSSNIYSAGYRIYDSTARVYLNVNETTLVSGSDQNSATLWQKDGNYYYIMYNNEKYYLRLTGNNSATVGLTTSTDYRFSLNGSNLRAYNNNYRYLVFSGGAWTSTRRGTYDSFSITEVTSDTPASQYVIDCNPYVNGSSTSVTPDTISKAISRIIETGVGEQVVVSKERYNYTKRVQQNQAGGYDTYFPLAAESTSTFDVIPQNNTGYIIGGSHTSYQQESGDVRVSSYYKISDGRLRVALNGATSYNGTRLEVLTQTYLSNGLKRIEDVYNKNNTSVSSTISGYTKMDATSLGLSKYGSSRDQLEETYANGDKNTLYGLHFMDASINMDNLVTIPVAYINDQEYHNLKMPEDCIDFSLKSKGFINFFAGTYYLNSGYENNSFFSLYKIERDGDNNIVAINRIAKIYGNLENNTGDYIYQYYGESKPSMSADYEMIFDCSWIENPTMVERALYYFEIPANTGEYALGSVSETGKYGAYLIYLDISANGARVEDKDRYDTAELFEYYKYGCELPKGVQLTQSGKIYNINDPYETVIVEYQDGFNTTDNLKIDSNNNFIYGNNAHTAVQYVGGSINSQVSGSAFYPNGKFRKLVETIIDTGRESGNDDLMRIETLDEYDSSGETLVKRTVIIYAGVDVTANKDELIKIIEFEYTTSDYDGIVMRFVRASTIGGFNLCFDKNIVVVKTKVDDERIHVNFGTAVGFTNISATSTNVLTNKNIDLVELNKTVNGQPNLNYYEKPTIGDKLVNLYYYSPEEITEETTVTFTPTHFSPSVDAQSLNYVITITPPEGQLITAYAYLENITSCQKSTFVDTYDPQTNPTGSVIAKTVTVNINSVQVNSTTLTTEKQTINAQG